MRFAEVNDLPVVLAGHGVDVALAQEAHVVGVFQLGDGAWVAAEFLVIELDGALVLLSAMEQLIFLVALNGSGDTRHGHGERDQNQRHHEQNGQHDIARFRILDLATTIHIAGSLCLILHLILNQGQTLRIAVG